MKNNFTSILLFFITVFSFSALVAQPTNDDCANAISLTVETNGDCPANAVTGTNIDATDSGVAHSCANYSGGDVWYSVLVPASGEITITTSDAGGITDTGMEVYSGSCGSLSSIECDDDGGAGTFSEVALTGQTPGATLYIAVWEYGNNSFGDFNICAQAPPDPPANDECINADPVSINTDGTCTLFTSGTIAGATDSGGNGTCGGTSDDDVWFSFTATTKYVDIELNNVSGSTTDLYHRVVEVSCAGTEILCSDPNTSTLTCLVIGTTYYIQVYSFTATSGQNTTFDVCLKGYDNVDQTGGSTCQFSIDDPNFEDNGAICDDFTFPASTTGTDADVDDPDIDYGCLGSTPNPAWYYMEMESAGDFDFTISADPAVDVDFAVWGPFSSLSAATSSCNWGVPIVCDYTTASGGSGTIPCTEVGEVYMVLITNFSGDPTDITMSQTGGSGAPDCSIVMPVVLDILKAENMGDYNMISWKTKTEVNSRYFEIEKSLDLSNWNTISSVYSQNNLYGASYSTKDLEPDRINYYRIKMIDFDGQYEYSGIVMVLENAVDKFSEVFPNPTTDRIKINLNLENDEQISFNVINPAGKVVFQESVKIGKGGSIKEIDFSDFSTGIYLLRIETSVNSYLEKIIKY